MIHIYIDADGCPVKDEVYKVARRLNIRVFVVCNSRLRVPEHVLFELAVVSDQFDAADNWIVDRIAASDIVVTADIPLAARCLQKGARALDPKGRVFSQESIGNALADRELASYLRDMGEMTGGPAPFHPRDRSRFLQRLNELIQAIMKSEREAKDP